MDKQLEREIISLNSEKKMAEAALKGHQWQMSQQLNGAMGQDMMDVLTGKKVVKFPFWKRVKNSINKFLLNFIILNKNEETENGI